MSLRPYWWCSELFAQFWYVTIKIAVLSGVIEWIICSEMPCPYHMSWMPLGNTLLTCHASWDMLLIKGAGDKSLKMCYEMLPNNSYLIVQASCHFETTLNHKWSDICKPQVIWGSLHYNFVVGDIVPLVLNPPVKFIEIIYNMTYTRMAMSHTYMPGTRIWQY